MIPVQNQVIKRLIACRGFSGPPEEFWPFFLETLVQLAGGERGLLLFGERVETGEANPGGEEEIGVAGERAALRWKPFSQWPVKGREFVSPIPVDGRQFCALAEEALEAGSDCSHGLGRAGETALVLLGLETAEGERPVVAMLVLRDKVRDEVAEAAKTVLNARDCVRVYQRGKALQQVRIDVVNFGRVLDIMTQLNRHDCFLAAAMTLCNEAASQYACDRAAFGWMKGGYVRLQAVSHLERFDRKMNLVQDLEACMEEAADQDTEILLPALEGSGSIHRDHEKFRAAHGVDHVLTLPLRAGDECLGAITIEREGLAFGGDDVTGFRVLADQAAIRLQHLYLTDRWWGARLAAGMRRRLAKFLGFERTWLKALAVAGMIGLGFLVLGRLEYRVEGEFIIRSEDLTHVPTPFDGFLDAVHFRVGDRAEEGEVLVELDDSQHLLEESAALAQIQRYKSEAEKAETDSRLADMRVSQALEAQARAGLELTRHRLAMAKVRAPFSGIVVAGDLQDRLGAPVKAGEILLRVTRIEDMYVEIEIEERDIHHVLDSETGEFAFASLPGRKFGLAIENIEPMAVSKSSGNVFIARGMPDDAPQAWWRPGMTGVAKIDAGERSPLWIFTHRLVDFLRMKLWW